MFERQMRSVLEEMARSFPVVTVTGPRQSGKTTLVKMVFPDKAYVSLEDLDTREFAHTDPRGFLNQYAQGAVIDEIQHVPGLLSYIQTLVDQSNQSGLFILTGSNQFKYLQSITQSLAGRTGILKLLPFAYDEIYFDRARPLNTVLHTGFYPRIFDQNVRPGFFYAAYFETYIDRDVRTLLKIKDLMQFQKFVRICAGRTGQLVNFSAIANEIGVTHKTVKEWLSILEASYIVYLLKPYHRNYNKRILKSPKLYFVDVGLAAHLLGIEAPDQLITHPLRGELFETFVVAEFLKYRFNAGKSDNLYFFRDRTGNEVDLIVEIGARPVPLEIKSAQTVSPTFFKGLNTFRKLERRTPGAFLIMGTSIRQDRSACRVRGFSQLSEIFEKLDGF